MALTADPTRALSEAIDAFIKAAGSDAKYKDVVGKLQAVDHEIGDAGEDKPSAPARDSADDPYSFETAQKRHTERLTASNAANADTGTDGATGGEGK